MPKVEKAIHLDAFKLYMEIGGMSPDFLSQFGKEIGKSARTAKRWEKDLDWKERAKKPITEAVENLEAAQTVNAEELITGLLDLCQNRMEGLETQATYLRAIFGTVFPRIPTPENPNPENAIKINSIGELKELVLAQSRLARDEQAFMRLVLTLVGKPEQILEDRMTVQFVGSPEGLFGDSEDT